MKFKEGEFAQKFFCRGFWRWTRLSPSPLISPKDPPYPTRMGVREEVGCFTAQ